MVKTSYIGWWVFAFTLLASMAGLAYWRQGELPDLNFSVGPDLVVRSAGSDMESTEPQLLLQRGDRVTAMSGHAVSRLEDIRAIAANVLKAAGPTEEAIQTEVQAVRPLHRFTLTLTNQQFDRNSLPPDVEPTDDLVEVDGRALPGKVGPEGLKSIMASRPEAILGFERRNAVFTVKARLLDGRVQDVFIIPFILALIVMLVLGRFSSVRLDPRLPLSVAIETAFIATISILLLRYQWVISDIIVAGAVASSLILARPVAYLGRAAASDDDAMGGPLASLALALVAAVAAIVMVRQELFTAERALQFSAVIGFLFIVYELVAGMSRGAAQTVLERSAYLVGIVVASVVAGLFAYFSNADAFLEAFWADFAVVIVGLVWLSDMVLCLRGPALTGLDEIVSPDQRKTLVLDYFDLLEDEMPGSKFRVVLHRPAGSVAISKGLTGFEVNGVDQALQDAMTILVEEGGHIPLPEIQRHTHPLAGIAQTMQMTLAFRAFPPEGAADVENINVMVVGLRAQRMDDPPAPAPLEVLDRAREAIQATTWMAALLEGLPHLTGAVEQTGPAEPTIAPEVVDALEARADELETEVERLQQDRSELASHLDLIGHQIESIGAPALSHVDQLLEPELVDGLEYLVQTDEPVVLCGAAGSGKSFVAFAAHRLDAAFPGTLIVLDAVDMLDEGGFSDVDDFPQDLLDTIIGGGLLVRSAHLLGAQQIKALCNRSRETFRLLLAFDEPAPEQQSALDSYGDDVRELLEHRELVLPRFSRRDVRESVIRHYFDRANTRHRKRLVGIAPGAMDALLDYAFPGEVSECIVLIDAAVSRCQGEVLDLTDFPRFD